MPGLKNERVTLKGEIIWADVYELNDWGKWSVGFYPDFSSLEKVRELQSDGLKNKVKKNEETNRWFVAFSKPPKIQKKDGTEILLAAPLLWDGRDPPVDGKYPPLRENIGRGSEGEIRLQVYQHGTPGGGKAKAARLEEVVVTKLVPYETGKPNGEDQWQNT
jgi:hypothetical protein